MPRAIIKEIEATAILPSRINDLLTLRCCQNFAIGSQMADDGGVALYNVPSKAGGLMPDKELRIPFLFIGVWVCVMVSVPILNWTLGEGAKVTAIAAGVCAQTLAVVAVLRLRWSWEKIGRILLIVATLTLLVEAVGSATGFPFGAYYYTDKLQPQLLHVPLVIPLAWFMLLPAAWVIAHRWRHNRWKFAAVSALAFTAWDLFLDPQMVGWGLWVWENPSGYFGIPYSNYAGWLLVSFGLTALLFGRFGIEKLAASKPAAQLLVLIYAVTWFLELFGLAFFWGQPAPAIVGGVIMGGFLWLGWSQFPPFENVPLPALLKS